MKKRLLPLSILLVLSIFAVIICWPLLVWAESYFGYQTIGTVSNQIMTLGSTYANIKSSYQYTANGTETIDTIYVYSKTYNTDDTLLLGIYTVTDTTPNTRVWYDTVIINAIQWYSIPVGLSLTNGVTYTLAIANGGDIAGADAPRVYYDTTISSGDAYIWQDSTMPVNWTGATTNNKIWSIYVAYSTGGAQPATGQVIKFHK